MNSVVKSERTSQVQEDQEISALRKALQAAKEIWVRKSTEVKEILSQKKKEMEVLQVERLRIAEERLKFEDALKKKDREIQQLKVKIRSSLPDSPNPRTKSPEVVLSPGPPSSPLENGSFFSNNLDGPSSSLPHTFDYNETSCLPPSPAKNRTIDVMKQVLQEKQDLLKDAQSKLKEITAQVNAKENDLALCKKQFEDLIHSDYFRTRDFFHETSELKKSMAALENELSEKRTKHSLANTDFERLQEFCDSLEGVVDYLEDVDGKDEMQNDHYWNVQDSLECTPLEEAKWYWGPLGKEETYQILANKPSGQFIVRDSTSQPGNYVLCVRVNVGNTEEDRINDVLMIHIRKIDGQFGFFRSKSHFSTVSQLVSYYCKHPLTELNPSLKVTLKVPASRLNGPRAVKLKSPISMESPIVARKQPYYKYSDEGLAYLNIMPVEMGDIIDHLADLTPHWEVIGYGLGVSDAVKTLRPSEVEPKTKCLRMLEQWIERGQDSTWGKLFDVLMKNQLNSTVAKLRQSVNSS
jgi:hypothetical protein